MCDKAVWQLRTSSSHLPYILDHTDHIAFVGTTMGTEPFTDLDFADDVALLTEMPSVLVLALQIMNHEDKFLAFQLTG